ncbi:MAG: S-layer homology domain-containing protein [Candidatus Gracilibacteria bacterium]
MKNFIKQLVLVIFGLSLFANAQAVSAATFSDVQGDNTYYDAVEYLKEKDIINGYNDGTFGPDKAINRAEATKIITKAFKIDTTKDYEESFPDVKKANWFFTFVMAGKEDGFIKGYDDGTFQPAKQVKLSETLKMVLSAGKVELSKEVTTDVFMDVKEEDWVAIYALYAREHNILLADKEGNIYPGKEMTRGAFAEIIYRTMVVLENNGKEFPIYKNWTTYEGIDLPFEMKYDSEIWEIIKTPHDVIFFNPDEDNNQFSAARIYPNSAKVEVTIDENEAKSSAEVYFNDIKSYFPDAKYTEFTWDKFKALEVLYSDEKIVDWYIYLDSDYVLAVYAQYGEGPESYRSPILIQAMLSTLKYKEVDLNVDDNSEELLATIFKNILVEGKGMQMLNTLPDKIIIETDSVGVGTGAVDYYYSEGVDYTFKYERESDVILDKRKGKTSEF